jgi:hypothetical protein
MLKSHSVQTHSAASALARTNGTIGYDFKDIADTTSKVLTQLSEISHVDSSRAIVVELRQHVSTNLGRSRDINQANAALAHQSR